jgi:hypothetical protein
MRKNPIAASGNRMPYQGIMIPNSPQTTDKATVATIVRDFWPEDQSCAIDRQNDATAIRNTPPSSAIRRYNPCACNLMRMMPKMRNGAQNPEARRRFAHRTAVPLKE